jgi:hypothetical protein
MTVCAHRGIPLPAAGQGAPPADHRTVREDGLEATAPREGDASAAGAAAPASSSATVDSGNGQTCYARGFMLRQRQINAGQQQPGWAGPPALGCGGGQRGVRGGPLLGAAVPGQRQHGGHGGG